MLNNFRFHKFLIPLFYLIALIVFQKTISSLDNEFIIPKINSTVSVILIAENDSNFIQESLDSLYSQTLHNIEIIVVKNGRITNTKLKNSLLLSQKKDPRLKFIYENNKINSGKALNNALNQTESEFIYFLNSNDLLEPTSLEKLMWFLVSHKEISVVNGYTVEFSANTTTLSKTSFFSSGKKLLGQGPISISMMFRKSMFEISQKKTKEKFVNFDSTISNQYFVIWDFILNCANKKKMFYTLEEVIDFKRNTNSIPDIDHQNFISLHLKKKYSKFYKENNENIFLENSFEWYSTFFQINTKIIFKNELQKNQFLNIPLISPEINPLSNQNTNTKTKFKVLLIIETLKLNSLNKFYYNLVKQLIKSNFQVTVLITSNNNNNLNPKNKKTLFFEKDFSSFSDFSSYSISNRIFQQLTVDVFYLQNFLKIEDYYRFVTYIISSRSINYILISHSKIGYYLLPVLKSNFPTKSFIDFIDDQQHQNQITKLNSESSFLDYNLLFQKNLDLTVVGSRYLADILIESTVKLRTNNNVIRSDKQLTLLKNFIKISYTNVDSKYFHRDPDFRKSVREQYNISMNQTVILFAGILNENKDPLFFFQIIDQLISRQKFKNNFIVLICGDGPLRTQLQTQINEKNLDKIMILLGTVPSDEMIQIYSSADVLVSTSNQPHIEGVLFEAMSSQLTVIAKDIGPQSELLQRETSYLIDSSTHFKRSQKAVQLDYVKILEELLSDPKIITEKGHRARQIILENFSVESMGKQFSQFLRESNLKKQREGIESYHPDLDTAVVLATAGLNNVWLSNQHQISNELEGDLNQCKQDLHSSRGLLKDLRKTEALCKEESIQHSQYVKECEALFLENL